MILPVPGEVDGDDFEAAASQPARLVSPPGAVLASSVDEDYQPWLDRSPRRRSAMRSSGLSSPTDIRTMPGSTPAIARPSASSC